MAKSAAAQTLILLHSAQEQMGLAEAASALRSLVQIAHQNSCAHGDDQPMSVR